MPSLRHRDLEYTIDQVVDSYDTSSEINNLESATLPNRRAVLKAFHHLVPVCFMGFYSSRGLNRDNLRHSISEHLYPAYETLVEQIERAVTYHDTDSDQRHPPGWSEQTVLELFKALPQIRGILNTDALAAYEGDPAAGSLEEIIFSYPTIRAITAHRIAHQLYSTGVPMIPRIIAECAHSETGIDIHPGAQIGPSFFVDHGTGVVIGETAVIGSSVKIYQGVTLGALSTARSHETDGRARKRHPTIEDDVTIYSGAKILGGDTIIGKGATIGGNVWLVDSVAAGAKIFGRESS
ncbi:MAG: serine acetyltransferase [Polyangiaceae bacterium]|nr:serine acetyltransferase [Polyangiaceae bacterium]